MLVYHFWWGYRIAQSKFLALKAWKDICLPKKVDGLGPRRFWDINLVFPDRLLWRLASRSQGL